jgi:hypothetical protein
MIGILGYTAVPKCYLPGFHRATSGPWGTSLWRKSPLEASLHPHCQGSTPQHVSVLFINRKGINWKQCCGSMTFWGGSGTSADPCLWPLDLDPTIIVIDLQEVNKKLIYKKTFGCLLVEGTFTSFLKKVKKSHKIVGTKVFLTIFAWR